jgi:hypothetical protein
VQIPVSHIVKHRADRADVGTLLASPVHKQLIRPGRSEIDGVDGFRFAHALIREAAYDALPKQLRAQLHKRMATQLKARAGTQAEVVRYHLERAYRPRRTPDRGRDRNSASTQTVSTKGGHHLGRTNPVVALDPGLSLRTSTPERRRTMSFSQFDTPITLARALIGSILNVTGPLKTDPDRIGDIATIKIFVQIQQTQTQTVAAGHTVIKGVGLKSWSCPITIQSGGFQPGSALASATTVEQYSNTDEYYPYTWTQKVTFK